MASSLIFVSPKTPDRSRPSLMGCLGPGGLAMAEPVRSGRNHMMGRYLSLTCQIATEGEQAEGGLALLELRDKDFISDKGPPVPASDFVWDTRLAKDASSGFAERLGSRPRRK